MTRSAGSVRPCARLRYRSGAPQHREEADSHHHGQEGDDRRGEAVVDGHTRPGRWIDDEDAQHLDVVPDDTDVVDPRPEVGRQADRPLDVAGGIDLMLAQGGASGRGRNEQPKAFPDGQAVRDDLDSATRRDGRRLELDRRIIRLMGKERGRRSSEQEDHRQGG